jgi:hypothetical protein
VTTMAMAVLKSSGRTSNVQPPAFAVSVGT